MRIAPIFLIGILLGMLPMAAHADQSIAAWDAEGIALERESGIPRLRLPNNIPPQNSPSKQLVHCSAGAAGRPIIFIWLKPQDCDAWGKYVVDYYHKYEKQLEDFVARRQTEKDSIAELGRQQHAGFGRRIIYALFLCFPATSTCQMQGAARVTFMGFEPDMTFDSLATCEHYAGIVSGRSMPLKDGRFPIDDMWYECRGKQVGTWETVQ